MEFGKKKKVKGGEAMSADMMIICQEDDSGFDGEHYDLAFLIDETSMGDPHTEFGKWFQERYSGAPSMADKICGLREHNYKTLTGSDLVAIKDALKNMKFREGLNKIKLLEYLQEHIGKHISTENW
jgi:hypothetical protein